MTQAYNFSAGPAKISDTAKEKLAQAIIDFEGTGLSIVEISHRDPLYKDNIHPKAYALFKELLNVPDDYEIIFKAGGASIEFGDIVRNLSGGKITQYVETGYWSKKAFSVAKGLANDNVGLGAESIDGLLGFPGEIRLLHAEDFFNLAAYVHITSNETIGGIRYVQFPDAGGVPLVADMSSELFTRVFDARDFGCIYAAGQKNFGMAGFSVVIVRKDLLGKVLPGTTEFQNYAKLAEAESALNTPPTVSVYLAGVIAEEIKNQGGIPEMARLAEKKSGLVYAAIDGSEGFYISPVAPAFRSLVNIPFLLREKELEEDFKAEAAREGLLTLDGHRSVGGLRASVYIGMPIEGARTLSEFMEDYVLRKG